MPRRASAVAISTPIGWARPTGRAQTKVSLPPGSAACFYSDGLTDARQPGGALFGRGRLVETLRSLGQRPAAAELLGRVRAQADICRDDMAACVIAPEASGAAAADGALTHVEELEADYGELSGTDVGSFLQSCAISPAETAQALEASGLIVRLRIRNNRTNADSFLKDTFNECYAFQADATYHDASSLQH